MAIPGERSDIDGVLSNEKNWSELPEDILHTFSCCVQEMAVVGPNHQSSPTTLSWLLECHLERHQDLENSILRFYCLSSGSRRARLHGPGCRYLLAYVLGNSERYLLNPLTCNQIHIPFVNDLGFSPDYIGPDLIKGGDIVVISGIKNYSDSWNTPPNLMAFWHPNANDWVYVEGVGHSANAFYMGKYFSNDRQTGITNVVDIATKKLAYQVPPPEGTNPFLKGYTVMVESGGKILRLFYHYEAEPCHFDIYILYFGDGEPKPCWVKTTDIGDQMLFMQYYQGLSFCASNFAGFKGNCIYFLKDMQYLCRYDIGDGTTEVLPCPFDSVGTWVCT